MKLRIKSSLGLVIMATIILQSCTADIRTRLIKKKGITVENSIKGKAILDHAFTAHGFNELEKYSVYSFDAYDKWRGLMGRMGKLWPNKETNLHFNYEIGSFDGQVKFLDGKREGVTAGLQNWNYYEQDSNENPKLVKKDKRISFGIPAIHYFTEMIGRLRAAPIISYAGEEEFKGERYDLVFCTWGKESPHMEADQYVAWINKKTGLLDVTQYTIRDNYLKMPGTRMFHGSVEYGDYRSINGIMISHEHTVYLMDPESDKKKNLHQLIISNFEFDGFNIKKIRPFEHITKGGNFK